MFMTNKKGKNKLLKMFLAAGMVATPLVSTSMISADTVNSGISSNTGNYTINVGKYHFGSELSGFATPNSTIYASNTSDFAQSVSVRTNNYLTGEFHLSNTYIRQLNLKPGDTLYLRSGNAEGTSYGATTKVVVNYEKPLVTRGNISGNKGGVYYGDTIEGTAYPGANVYVSTSPDYNNYITVTVDTDGTFDVPASQLELLSGYQAGTTVYMKSAESPSSKFMSDSSSISILNTDDYSGILASDFSINLNTELTDELAIFKAGVVAIDKNGELDEVTVKSSNVNTKEAGVYQMTFVSASGHERTVNVTVA
ncbi:hypothetical protein RV08_GL001580 [Enterococcus mundtii]|nr:hypothetical protein RV08_GL001580 [Enterococcus mundtii]